MGVQPIVQEPSRCGELTSDMPKHPQPTTAYFVSDLHLFARRSSAEEHLEPMRRLAQRAGTFVLGGDIFDFHWTTLDSIAHTVDAAEHWLSDLVGSAPHCEFHMLLGNHDHHGCFMQRLGKLAGAHENLRWDPYFVRLGESLFLHGDAADGDATHAGLQKARRSKLHAKRGRTANMLYDAVIQTGAHRPVPIMAYPKRRTARRLLKYMHDIGHGPKTGTRNVYFGHTHRALDGYQYGGVNFHNGGAPIKGVPFRIVPADVRLPAARRAG